MDKEKSTLANNTAKKQQMMATQKYNKIKSNPVLFAKAFITTVNNKTKKKEPWTARWYQAEMLLDKSYKKVARCGRRTGKGLFALPIDKLLGSLFFIR